MAGFFSEDQKTPVIWTCSSWEKLAWEILICFHPGGLAWDNRTPSLRDLWLWWGNRKLTVIWRGTGILPRGDGGSVSGLLDWIYVAETWICEEEIWIFEDETWVCEETCIC